MQFCGREKPYNFTYKDYNNRVTFVSAINGRETTSSLTCTRQHCGNGNLNVMERVTEIMEERPPVS